MDKKGNYSVIFHQNTYQGKWFAVHRDHLIDYFGRDPNKVDRTKIQMASGKTQVEAAKNYAKKYD